MKTNQGNKKLIAIILSVLALICFSVSVALFGGTNVQAATLSGVELSDNYTVGSKVDLPIGTIEVSGTSCHVKPIIYYPDGSAYEVDQATLSQKGKYVVEYSAELNGKIYSFKESFIANEYVFSNSGTGEPLKYLHNETYDIDGVHFTIKSGEKAVYNKIIDLSDNTKDDTLIKIDAIPKVSGVRDAETLMLVFTDLYDANNTFNIRLKRAPVGDSDNYELYTYIAAAHNSEPLSGWDVLNGKPTLFAGNSVYGYGVRNGLAGGLHYTGEFEDAHAPFDLRLNYADKKFYVYYPPNDGDSKMKMAVDLINDFSNPWEGFTTGEALLSIYATDYSIPSGSFNGIIMELDGENLSAGIAEDGTVGATTVTKAPVPSIDFGDYGNESNIPNAMVGYPYKLFDAEIVSIYGGEQITTKVYYAYGTQSRYELDIKDGSFIPDRAGLYTVVYTCSDVFGNKEEAYLDIAAIGAEYDDISVSVNGYEDYATCEVGEMFAVIDQSGVSYENNLGNVTIEIFAEHVQSGYKIKVENGRFLADRAGAWKISYIVKDYVTREGVFPYDVTVNANLKVVFQPDDVEDFLNYLIVGAKNPIPVMPYIDYNDSPEVKHVQASYIVDTDNNQIPVVDGFATPTTAGEYSVVYKQTSIAEEENEYRMKATAVDVGFKNIENFHLGKYFYSEDISNYGGNMMYVYFDIAPNGTADFIRPLNATNIKFSFKLDANNNNASAVILTFTDINNPDQKVKITFKNGGSIVSINDESEYSVNGYNLSNNFYYVTIKGGEFSVGPRTVKLDKYLNGDTYTGFDSMLVNTSIQIVSDDGVSENTRVIVEEVGNQVFGYTKPNSTTTVESFDRFDPELVVVEYPSSKILVNETVKIGKSKMIDVIDPYSYAKFSVVDGDGNIVKDDNGVLLENVSLNNEYYITPTTTGILNIIYDFGDSTNRIEGDVTTVDVISREAPVITVSGGARTGKVGTAFTIGTATCKNADLYVYVLPPSGRMKKVDGKKYTPTKKGTYKVMFVAIDEWGNMGIEEYTVTVS